MATSTENSKHMKPKMMLRLPDLEQAKRAVLNSLAAASSQESYGRRSIVHWLVLFRTPSRI
jgi:hypothetical protein